MRLQSPHPQKLQQNVGGGGGLGEIPLALGKIWRLCMDNAVGMT